MQFSPDQMKNAANSAESLLKAFANANRLMILCQLMDGEKSVSEIAQAVPITKSALSQHLARLRSAHLVQTRREGLTIFYVLEGEVPERVVRLFFDLYCANDAELPTFGKAGSL